MSDKRIDDLDFSDLDLDMNDDAASGFDDEFGSDADDGALDGDERPSSGKKKPDMFTYAIYAAMGIAVVGVVVWQMGLLGGGNSGQPYQAPGMNGQPQAGGEIAIPGTEAADMQPATADPFNVMGTPDQLPPQDNAAAMEAMNPGSVAPDGGMPMTGQDNAMMGQPGFPASPEETPLTGVLNATDNSPLQPQQPGVPTQAGDTVPMPAPVPVGQDLSNIPVSPPVNGVDATALAPLPEAAPAMDAAPVATNAVTMDTTGADSTATAAALQQIMTRLDGLEKRMDNQASAANDNLSAEVQALKNTINELKSSRGSVSSASESKPAAKPAAKKKTSTAKKRSTSASSSAKKSGSSWDKPYQGGAAVSGSSSASGNTSGYALRAAQPDSAWVSTPDGNLRQLRVGESVPGLGTVTAIKQSGGQWTVQTSNGNITQ